MFGSIPVSQLIYERLSGDSRITDVVGTNIYGTNGAPEGTDLPMLLFYMTRSTFGGPIGHAYAANIDSETMQFEVRVICPGMDNTPIEAVAVAQLELLAGQFIQAEYKGRPFSAGFIANGEVPFTTLVTGERFYQQLGTVYDVELTWGVG